jgi:hypothetical protein
LLASGGIIVSIVSVKVQTSQCRGRKKAKQQKMKMIISSRGLPGVLTRTKLSLTRKKSQALIPTLLNMKRRKDKQLQLQLLLPQLGCQALLKLPHSQPQLCSRMMMMVMICRALLKLPHFQPQLCSLMMMMVKMCHVQRQWVPQHRTPRPLLLPLPDGIEDLQALVKETQPSLRQHWHPKPLLLPLPDGIEDLQALVKETQPSLRQHRHPKPLHLPPAGIEGLHQLPLFDQLPQLPLFDQLPKHQLISLRIRRIPVMMMEE